jgi:hypothetical protein
MRKTLVLALILAAILAVSSAAVFPHPAWRDTGNQEQSKGEGVTLAGTIVDTGRPTAALEVEDEEYILHLGPLWHQERDEYPFRKDQAVKVTGVVEEIYGRLHIYPFAIESEGKSITLIDEDDTHVWADCHGYDSEHDWHDRSHMRSWRRHSHM